MLSDLCILCSIAMRCEDDESKNSQLGSAEGAVNMYSETVMRGMRQVSNFGSGQVMQYSMCRAISMVSTLVLCSLVRVSAHSFSSFLRYADLCVVCPHDCDTAVFENWHLLCPNCFGEPM